MLIQYLELSFLNFSRVKEESGGSFLKCAGISFLNNQ